MNEKATNSDESRTAVGGPGCNEGLGPLLEDWAEAACVRFVNRSDGQRTTETVSRDELMQLMRAAQATERARWIAAAAEAMPVQKAMAFIAHATRA